MCEYEIMQRCSADKDPGVSRTFSQCSASSQQIIIHRGVMKRSDKTSIMSFGDTIETFRRHRARCVYRAHRSQRGWGTKRSFIVERRLIGNRCITNARIIAFHYFKHTSMPLCITQADARKLTFTVHRIAEWQIYSLVTLAINLSRCSTSNHTGPPRCVAIQSNLAMPSNPRSIGQPF